MSAEPFTLTAGTRVVIRPIRPDDKEGLQDGLRRLSDETIRRRFLAAKPRFSSAELRYLTEVDGHDHIALVAVEAEEPGRIVAVARAVRFADAPDRAEMAIVVGDAVQGQGLGRELAHRLAEAALAHGIDYFTATMLGENLAARRLVKTIAARLERDRISAGYREMVVALAA